MGIRTSPVCCSSMSMPPSTVSVASFALGEVVEVVNKPPGSYYEATVISRLANGSYVVEYHTKLNDDENYCFLTETVYPMDLRPLPSTIDVSATGFSLNQVVDAYEHRGWWVTTITGRKDSDPDSYLVYWPPVDRDVEFHSSELRVHQEWIGGDDWILP
ncbi:protein AGENET DOMAIN (AGD)-CONTAINING P1-like [Prosopis cineraria]|uniref:protein AGENET DOMAIN (AGD)-CONTAINING P1-like n=1 Tax=Prosopis cineraria TaxID=364024 RepID=UPI00240F3C52|nr:protein AGENET DOMAIN (AGD)-CONTAINING P1-like [Prosopis cineraria]